MPNAIWQASDSEHHPWLETVDRHRHRTDEGHPDKQEGRYLVRPKLSPVQQIAVDDAVEHNARARGQRSAGDHRRRHFDHFLHHAECRRAARARRVVGQRPQFSGDRILLGCRH